MNLTKLLCSPEGKTLEFKRDLSSPEGFLRTAVAFANTAGGTILIGVEDRTRHVRGVSDPLAVEERVANLIRDAISPRLLPDIELLSYRTTQVLAIRVYPSASRPHHLIGMGPDAGVYVRVGSSNRRADTDLVAEMRRFSRGESFDERAMPDLDSEALDFRAASESFAQFRKLKRGDLDVLGLRTSHQGRKVLTVGGALLYGRDRLTYFPDAWIQAGRFQGIDKSKMLDRADLKMPLADTVAPAVAFVEKHAMQAVEIGPVHSRPRWSVPTVAIREALVNAVAHADYSQRGAPIRLAMFDDRLEVENPGLLPFGLTLDDLPHGVSKLRNRVIGRVLHELGLVEQWGSGVQRMIATCRATGLAPPVWEEIGLRMRVTIRTEQVGEVSADETDRAILEQLDTQGALSTKEIASAISRSTRATRTRLARLVEMGLAMEIGSGPQDPRRTYHKAGS